VIDRFHAKYVAAPVSQIYELAEKVAHDEWLVVEIAGENLEGKEVRKTVALPMGEGATGRDRIRAGGVTLAQLGDDLEVANVKFGSRARKLGVEQGFRIVDVQVPNPARPSQNWVFLPALLLVGLVWWRQGRRMAAPAR
jgi:hypothetical protein